jgi:hypothetical protein
VQAPQNPWAVVSTKPVTDDQWRVVSSKPVTPTQAPPPEEPSFGAQLWDSVSRFGSRLGHDVVDPFIEVGKRSVERIKKNDPKDAVVGGPVAAAIGGYGLDLGKGILQAQGDEFTKARAAYDKGDHGKAALHTLAYLAPIIGPMLDQWATQTGEGKGPEVAADMTAMFALPEAAKMLPSAVRVGKLSSLNPAEAEAIAAAQKAGVPIDAGTATGNSAIKAIQKSAEKVSVLGSKAGATGEQATQRGFANLGEQLAAKANAGGRATTLEQAGDTVASSVKKAAAKKGQQADTAYSALRGMATPGVDLTVVQDKLRPIYEQLKREQEIAPQQGATARATIALDRLMNVGADTQWGVGQTSRVKPGIVPLSVADGALGELKSILRKVGDSEPWSKGDGVLRATVDALDGEVMKAAEGAGPDAVKALKQGRASTVLRHEALDIVDGLSTEPVKTVRALTSAKDSGISQLRSVEKYAPEAMPEIGRAYLEDLLGRATSEGGFKGADGLMADWQKLGTATKRTLFKDALTKDPAYLKDLDNFFLAAKRALNNPNPSGSGYQIAATMHAANLGTGIVNPTHWLLSGLAEAGGLTVSKMLRSPAVVKALTRGLNVPVGSATARAAATSALVRALKTEGLPVPQFAGGSKDKE